MTRTVDTPPTETKRRLPRPAWAALGTITALAADAVTERYDPTLGIIMFVCDVGFPAVLALVLVSVILFGGEDRKNRAFRLLRWAKDKPEPPAPPEPPAKTEAPGRKARGSRASGQIGAEGEARPEPVSSRGAAARRAARR
jgi:hypothetical protein